MRKPTVKYKVSHAEDAECSLGVALLVILAAPALLVVSACTLAVLALIGIIPHE